MSLTVNPDHIATGRPLRQAALQMQPGEEQPRSMIRNRVWFETPPETVPGKYSGVVFDRLTSIGKIVHRTGQWVGGSSAIYLVRCRCGTYETRRPRVLRDKTGPGMCCNCEHTERLRAGTAKRGPVVRTVTAQERHDRFNAMRDEVRRLGMTWEKTSSGDRSYVSIGGGPWVWARELVDLGGLEAFRAYLRREGVVATIGARP